MEEKEDNKYNKTKNILQFEYIFNLPYNGNL